MDIKSITSVTLHSLKRCSVVPGSETGVQAPTLALGCGSLEGLSPSSCRILGLTFLPDWQLLFGVLPKPPGPHCCWHGCPVPRVSYFLSHTQAHLSTFYPDWDWESTFWLWLYFLKITFLGQGRQIWFFQSYDQPECLKAYLACLRGGKRDGGGREKMKWGLDFTL